MKKTILFVVLILLLAAVVPAQAAQGTVGEQIYIRFGDKLKFPAGQPFHIKHGWNVWQPSPNEPAEAVGLFKFELRVDGVLVKEDFVERYALGNPDEWPDDKVDIFMAWVYNFPEGMHGTHKFTASYYGPCAALYGSEACPHPTEVMLDWENTVVVTFVE